MHKSIASQDTLTLQTPAGAQAPTGEDSERVRSAGVLLCLSSAPSLELAQHLADAIIEQQLAACVSVLPGAMSVYRWQGVVCRETEAVLLIKTTKAVYPDLQAAWPDLHPYDVPELLAVSVVDGLPAYVSWLCGGLSEGRSGVSGSSTDTKQNEV